MSWGGYVLGDADQITFCRVRAQAEDLGIDFDGAGIARKLLGEEAADRQDLRAVLAGAGVTKAKLDAVTAAVLIWHSARNEVAVPVVERSSTPCGNAS